MTRVQSGDALFTYSIPDTMHPTLGSIVLVPWRRTKIEAVVWSADDTPDVPLPKIKSVVGVVNPQPVVTPWQRTLIDRISIAYHVPRTLFLHPIVPKKWKDITATASKSAAATSGTATIVWKRSRVELEDFTRGWVERPGSRCIVCPDVATAEYMATIIPNAVIFDHHTRETKRTALYEKILTEDATCVIGTWTALFSPFPVQPEICLIDESHPAYHLRDRAPFLSIPRALDRAQIPHVRTCSSPTLTSFRDRAPQVPEASVRRTLGTLFRHGQKIGIPPETEALIRSRQWSAVTLLAPRTGFASAVECRSCGTQLSCTRCHQQLRLVRADATHARCDQCSTLQTVPLTCATCGASDWKYRGYGLEAFHGYQREVQSIVPTSTVRLFSYQQLGKWRPALSDELVIVLLGEALRTWPDFSADERAWTYLASVEGKLGPTSMVYVQTVNQLDTFWQRWRFSYDQEWYTDELRRRREYAMPPMQEHWIAYRPDTTEQQAEQELRSHFGPLIDKIDIQFVTQRRRLANARRAVCIIRPKVTSDELSMLLKRAVPLPAPWSVDIDADSWVA